MPPGDDAEKSVERPTEASSESSVAEMSRDSQAKPQDLKDKEERQSELRKAGRTPSSADLPIMALGADAPAAKPPGSQRITPGEGGSGADLDRDAAAIKKAMDGPGTDEAAILKALEGKTPEQIEQLKKSYKGNLEK